MKNSIILLLVMVVFGTAAFAQKDFKEIELNIPSKVIDVHGSLLYNPENQNMPLAIMIQGSGPMDRNANSSVVNVHSNAGKYLAEDLAKQNIATYRYDKSAITDLTEKKIDYTTYTFDEFITDAKNVVAYFKKNYKFSKIYIIGHSQGSLVGMLASDKDVDGFISIAGAADSIDIVLTEQISSQAPVFREILVTSFEKLKKGEKVTEYPPALASIFNPSVQGFLASYAKYNPTEEIKKVKVPILLINGTKDIQVDEKQAEKLHKAAPESKIVIIENMNHLFKDIKGDRAENLASYKKENPDPNSKQLAEEIIKFIHDTE
ncbi:alpha/beta hydrolase [Aureivirga sp. CE67]|uniref:alpha/beta hydrolase n=1 Tax=Aureivirga sp. CE67 TaxID=1788983 RepID=UPI0018CB669E|nr:alpha/beta hydrolase [Aureivirga sp. CE67]